MRKLLIGGMLAATLWMLAYVPAYGDSPSGGPPGQGECQHGNSGQECKPDPQPEHGQDCEEHGPNEGGVNEDHCLPTTSATTSTVTTPPTTTSVTEPPPPVTTTSEPPPVTSTTTAPATTTSVVVPTPTNSHTPPTTHVGNSDEGSRTPSEAPSSPPDRLAFTGVEDIIPIVAIALVLLSIGSWFLWVGRKR